MNLSFMERGPQGYSNDYLALPTGLRWCCTFYEFAIGSLPDPSCRPGAFFTGDICTAPSTALHGQEEYQLTGI
jgi:hypothetical protein